MTLTSSLVGKKGLKISQLGFGGASIAGMSGAVPAEQARATIQSAVDYGLTYFDTAPFYGYGQSERLIGDGLRGVDKIVLSSKAGRLLRPGALQDPGPWVNPLPFTPEFDYSYDGIMRSYEDSLQRLGLDRIDILFLHDIGNLTHGLENGSIFFETAMTNGYKALEELRSSGAISAIGLGVNETAVCEAVLERGDWDVFMLAGRYTLIEQKPITSLLPKCAAQGVDIVIGGPFNSGVLVGGESYDYHAIPPEIRDKVLKLNEVCQAHGVDLAAAALQFPKAHPVVKSTLPGPRSVDEMKQIHDWWTQLIPTSFWTDLKTEKLLHPLVPVPD